MATQDEELEQFRHNAALAYLRGFREAIAGNPDAGDMRGSSYETGVIAGQKVLDEARIAAKQYSEALIEELKEVLKR